MAYPFGCQPTEAKPEVKSPKCTSAERDPLERYYSNMLDRAFEYGELRKENKELREKLKKARKEKKRWKRKYFKLYNDAINVLYNPNSLSLERNEVDFGIGTLPEGFGLKTVSDGLDLFKKK